MTRSPIHFRAQALGYTFPGSDTPLLHDLSFSIGPGLSLILGGDGRGKTTLLRLLAGELAPSRGQLFRQVRSQWRPRKDDAAPDATAVSVWLAAQRAAFAGWDRTREAELIEGFALAPHLGKQLHMLSTGHRRKLGLMAAAASSAPQVLLDTPYAGLDAPSRQCLSQVLAEAARGTDRAWVVADYEPPEDLEGVSLAEVVMLGD